MTTSNKEGEGKRDGLYGERGLGKEGKKGGGLKSDRQLEGNGRKVIGPKRKSECWNGTQWEEEKATQERGTDGTKAREMKGSKKEKGTGDDSIEEIIMYLKLGGGCHPGI